MLEEFLRKLQSADDARKRRWLFLSAAVVMFLVVYIWLAYFNNLIASVSVPPTAQVEGSGESGFSFLETMEVGLGVVYNFVSEIFGNIFGFIGAPRDYLIKP